MKKTVAILIIVLFFLTVMAVFFKYYVSKENKKGKIQMPSYSSYLDSERVPYFRQQDPSRIMQMPEMREIFKEFSIKPVSVLYSCNNKRRSGRSGRNERMEGKELLISKID